MTDLMIFALPIVVLAAMWIYLITVVNGLRDRVEKLEGCLGEQIRINSNIISRLQSNEAIQDNHGEQITALARLQ